MIMLQKPQQGRSRLINAMALLYITTGTNLMQSICVIKKAHIPLLALQVCSICHYDEIFLWQQCLFVIKLYLIINFINYGLPGPALVSLYLFSYKYTKDIVHTFKRWVFKEKRIYRFSTRYLHKTLSFLKWTHRIGCPNSS